MVEFKEAGLVKSLAGHDKDELYIIISVQGEYVSLSDGGTVSDEEIASLIRTHKQ